MARLILKRKLRDLLITNIELWLWQVSITDSDLISYYRLEAEGCYSTNKLLYSVYESVDT